MSEKRVVDVSALTDEQLDAELAKVRGHFEAQRAQFKAAVAVIENERTLRARAAKAKGPTVGAGTVIS